MSVVNENNKNNIGINLGNGQTFEDKKKEENGEDENDEDA